MNVIELEGDRNSPNKKLAILTNNMAEWLDALSNETCALPNQSDSLVRQYHQRDVTGSIKGHANDHIDQSSLREIGGNI